MYLAESANVVTEHVTAWQCTGCGRIEGAQPCVGICEDRRVEFVYASEHAEAIARLQGVSTQMDLLKSLVRQLACTHPRNGAWEKSFRALQERARRLLAATDDVQVVSG